MTVPLGHSSLVVSEEVYQRLISVLRGPASSTPAQPAPPGSGNPDHEG
jgi:hypothetical protein